MPKARTRKVRLSNRRGAILVEFVLVTSLFLSMMIGVVEAGRAGWEWLNIGHAAREGARWAIVHGTESGSLGSGQGGSTATLATVTAYVLTRTEIRPLIVNAVWTPNTNPGSTVLVTVQHQFTSFIPLVPSITLRGRSQMAISF